MSYPSSVFSWLLTSPDKLDKLSDYSGVTALGTALLNTYVCAVL